MFMSGQSKNEMGEWVHVTVFYSPKISANRYNILCTRMHTPTEGEGAREGYTQLAWVDQYSMLGTTVLNHNIHLPLYTIFSLFTYMHVRL